MPILLAAIGILAALYWIYRSRKSADSARPSQSPAIRKQDARQSLHWGYSARGKSKGHPVEGVADPRLSCATLLVLVAELDGGISRAEQDSILKQFRDVLGLPASEVEDLYASAKWLCSQEPDREEMARRLIKQTVALGGYETLPDMIQMVGEVGKADTGTVTDDTAQVIEKLKLLNA